MILHFTRNPDEAPRTVSELAGWSRWRNSAAFAVAHESLDRAVNQLTIPLPRRPGTFRSVTIGRSGREYSKRELAFAERLRPLLLAQGLTAASVGRRLAISSRTVSKHQENLYRKLGASDRLTAVLHAQHLGLLTVVAPAGGSPFTR